jgi:hypothetical protein
VFFITTKRVINSPRFTTQPPQLHHKNTTPKTHVFPDPPQKRPQNRAFLPRRHPKFLSNSNSGKSIAE